MQVNSIIELYPSHHVHDDARQRCDYCSCVSTALVERTEIVTHGLRRPMLAAPAQQPKKHTWPLAVTSAVNSPSARFSAAGGAMVTNMRTSWGNNDISLTTYAV